MSRRASLYSKQNPGKPRVRFPDELVFEDNIKENDLPALHSMLRRTSLQVDLNAINGAGLTPIHQAVLDGNLEAVKLLIEHGADVNVQDEDTWTPLHAACAEGHADVIEYLLEQGADKAIRNEDGERPIDLVDPSDFETVRVMLQGQVGTGQGDDDTDDDIDDDVENASKPKT